MRDRGRSTRTGWRWPGWVTGAVVAVVMVLSTCCPITAQDPAPAPQDAKPAVPTEPADEVENAPRGPEAPASPADGSDVFRQLFPGLFPAPRPQPLPADPAGPEVPADVPTDKNPANRPGVKLDAIDRLAPIDRNTQALWQRTRRRMQDGDWSQLLRTIEVLFKPGSEDTLTVREDGRLSSVRREAMSWLAKAPPEVRETFARRHQAAAEKQLHEALTLRDTALLAEVAMHYGWLAPGYEAADLLATRHLDRGEPGIAATWVRHLIDGQAPQAKRQNWQRKALLIAKLAGDRELQTRLETQLGDDARAVAADVSVTNAQTPVLADTDWPLLHGTPQRRAVAAGSEPVSMVRWSAPATFDSRIQEHIDRLGEQMAERGIPGVPVATPLLVGGRLILRTVDGLTALDAATGRLLWTVNNRNPAQGTASEQTSHPFAAGRADGESLDWHDVSELTDSRIAQQLYQESAYGVVSSDGRHVYVIDSPKPGLSETSERIPFFGGRQPEARRTAVAANVLRAYDVETGRTAWQAGGPDLQEVLSSELAGCFFLGAPVVDGDDLLIIGQKQTEIRLYVLDPDTGHLKWSQLIAFSDLPIERDGQRRAWSVQVAVSGPIVVCPTTVGWLVAVDRTRRAVLWAHRYTERATPDETEDPDQPNRFFPFGREVERTLGEPLAARWAVSAPVICQDRVIFTPLETEGFEDATGCIVCVDLARGERLWLESRGTLQYLAGVLDDRLVLVGVDEVRALSLEGDELWATALPEDGCISGRGVIAGGCLLQPMQRRTVLKVKLEDGQIAERLELTDATRPLGNLLMYRGMVLSQHPGEILALEQRASVEERLATVRQTGEFDVATVLLQAQYNLSRQEFADALKALHRLPMETFASAERVRAEDLLRRASQALIRSSPAEHAPLLEQLRRLASTPAQRHQADILEVATLLETGQTVAAFRNLLELVTEPDDGALSSTVDELVLSSRTAWLRGALHDVWHRLSTSERDSLSDEIASLIKSLEQTAEIEQLHRIAEVLQFHPAVAIPAQRLAAAAERDRRYADAMNWLRVLERHAADPTARAEYVLRLARQQLDYSDPDGAAATLARAGLGPVRGVKAASGKPNAGATTLEPNSSLAQTLAALTAEIERAERRQPSHVPFELNLQRATYGTDSQAIRCLEPARRTQDYVSRFQVLTHEEGYVTDRLTLIDVQDGSVYWSVPLRVRESASNVVDIRRAGQCFVVYNSGVLHALSLHDRRVLWTMPVEPPQAASDLQSEYETSVFVDLEETDPATDGSEPRMYSGEEFVAHIEGPATPVGGLAFANQDYVVYRTRRELLIIDVRTGDIRWTVKKPSPEARVIGTDEFVMLIDESHDSVRAFRAWDGKPVEKPAIATHLASTLWINQSVAVAVVRETQQGRHVIAIRARDPATNAELWSHEFELNAAFCQTADDELVVLRRDGRPSWIDLATGRRVDAAALPAALRLGRTQRYVVTDQEHVYLFLNADDSRQAIGEVPIIACNGSMVVFDRATGRELWRQNLSNQGLLWSSFHASPVLVFASHESRLFEFSSDLRLLAFDKHTGRKLLDEVVASDVGNLRSVVLRIADHCLDLHAYDQRFRLNIVPAIDSGRK